ncbi:S-adenosyl-L-methionine-dependent methyltransferase [Xylaria curta]|nr:S-adenosyl-L-methionine-dependent methyltransferase [Xylaria curta]
MDTKTDGGIIYWKSTAHNFRSSARLHLQHMLCQNTLGFLLEPHISQSVSSRSTDSLKIADLACGNGIWLTDLSHELPTATLHGFDINEIVFPSPSFLPPSVTMKKRDILSRPLAPEMTGVYDIIHVRSFLSLIHDENTTPFLSTVLAMLKPGGWLQWEELRSDFIIEPASPDLATDACKSLSRILRHISDRDGMTQDLVTRLDDHLVKHGFEEVHMVRSATRKQDYKAWTDDMLMIWEAVEIYFPSRTDDPHAPVTREVWMETFVKAIGETEKGVALHPSAVFTAVGRKPAE